MIRASSFRLPFASRGRPAVRADGRLPLLTAALLAAFAGGLIYVSVRNAREQALAGPVEVVTSVVVAATDVPAGTVLDHANVPTMFAVTRVAADQVPNDAITSLAAMEGQTTVSPIHAGERVLTSSLSAQVASTVAGPRAGLLPPGHVAIVLDVNEHISVGGAVEPTDHVDLIATIPVGSDADGHSSLPVTQAIVRDVRVLATGFRTRPPALPSPLSSTASAEPTPPAPYSTLTLALTPQDAVLVQHLLAQNVRLALALRRPDDEVSQTTPETTAEITRRFNLVSPDDAPASRPASSAPAPARTATPAPRGPAA